MYEPRYHFFPQEGWMNDPNGLIYYEGEYHLFYQYLWPRNWGHAVSRDLVHWEILPIALKPDELGEMYSGCVVADYTNSSGFFMSEKGGLVALFTQNNQRSAPLGPQIQSIAYSEDRGRSWTSYEQNPVIANPGEVNFRDPSVFWHAPTQAWIMVVMVKGDRVAFYRSLDLKRWEKASEFGAGQDVQGRVWECPSLFELLVDGDGRNRLWVLHSSLMQGQDFRPESLEMHYFLGHFDGYTFTNINPPEVVHWTDYGKDHYASIPWFGIPEEDGRRIWIGWCNNWCYAGDLPTGDRKGIMTIPRLLELKTSAEGISLFQRPIVELEQLREQSFQLARQEITDVQDLLLPIKGEAVEIIAEFQVGTASEFGLYVRKGLAEWTAVGYATTEAEVFVDRSRSGESGFNRHFAGRHSAALMLADGLLKLHIFVDVSSVEVFANEGERVISDLIFPDAESQGIEVYARNGTVLLRSLEVYTLHSAY